MTKVIRYGDASSFLQAAAPVLAGDPVSTNVIGSVAAAVRDGRRYERELWLVVHDESGTPVGLGMRTAPHYLVVSQMNRDAAESLGQYVADSERDLPGISGPAEVVAEVSSSVMAGLPGYRAIEQVRESVMLLGTLRTPARAAPGRARPLLPADTETVVEWLVAFAAEAGLPTAASANTVREEVERGGNHLRLWTDPGAPASSGNRTCVALAGHAPTVVTPAGSIARIGPVYTPPANRGRGYATALTHAVAADLQASGATVMLYVDNANPQAGRIYAGLGFQRAGEIVEVAIAAPAPNHIADPGTEAAPGTERPSPTGNTATG